jgi:hypothetical protein
MLPILSSLLLTILLSSPALAQEFRCASGTIRIVKNGKMSSENKKYCFNKTKTNLLSPKCLAKSCLAFSRKEKVEIKSLHSAMGKPGFKLCRELNGQPEIIEFSVGKTFFKLDRCLFDDKEFADTDFLLNHYLKR